MTLIRGRTLPRVGMGEYSCWSCQEGSRMTEIAQAMPARRLEAIGGALALVAGLTAIGVQIFAPLMTVHVTGVGGNYITQMSRWEVYAGFVSSRLGLAMLGI